MNRFHKFFVMFLVLSTALVRGQDFSKLSDEERKQLNEWMSERAERMLNAHKLNSEVHQAWADNKHTSPEIEKLRQRYKELQLELTRLQAQIQAKVLELPELKEKQKELGEENETVEKLSKGIKEKIEATK